MFTCDQVISLMNMVRDKKSQKEVQNIIKKWCICSDKINNECNCICSNIDPKIVKFFKYNY